jgi:hypothetical protein
MERVAFLIDDSGERIDCLLNPETVEVTRLAGVRPRGTASGQLTGAGLADDPLQFTGGGRTELVLDLLFDVELVETQVPPTDDDPEAVDAHENSAEGVAHPRLVSPDLGPDVVRDRRDRRDRRALRCSRSAAPTPLLAAPEGPVAGSAAGRRQPSTPSCRGGCAGGHPPRERRPAVPSWRWATARPGRL